MDEEVEDNRASEGGGSMRFSGQINETLFSQLIKETPRPSYIKSQRSGVAT